MNRLLVFSLLTILLSCGEGESESRTSILGDYEGAIQYYTVPFPDHTIYQPVSFTIKKHGLNNILIEINSDYELNVPVTRSLTGPTGDKIISLGYNKEVKHTADDIITLCGDTEVNDWGEMCGYYNKTNRTITIWFSWERTTNSEGSSGRLYAEQIDL